MRQEDGEFEARLGYRVRAKEGKEERKKEKSFKDNIHLTNTLEKPSDVFLLNKRVF